MTKILNHEESYKKKSIASIIHRNRLTLIKELFSRHLPEEQVTWSDFGCSSGFIIEEIIKEMESNFSIIQGFDHSEALLELARARKIKNTEFDFMDMNEVSDPKSSFDLVTCFETLEHVGNLESAVTNLFNHVNEKGKLIITIPNETGFPGLVKLLGRSALRKNAYGDFFNGKSYSDYAFTLLKNDRIGHFRESGKPGYGPHLGFDYRNYEEIIQSDFIESGMFRLIEKGSANFRMNLFYVYERVG